MQEEQQDPNVNDIDPKKDPPPELLSVNEKKCKLFQENLN